MLLPTILTGSCANIILKLYGSTALKHPVKSIARPDHMSHPVAFHIKSGKLDFAKPCRNRRPPSNSPAWLQLLMRLHASRRTSCVFFPLARENPCSWSFLHSSNLPRPPSSSPISIFSPPNSLVFLSPKESMQLPGLKTSWLTSHVHGWSSLPLKPCPGTLCAGSYSPSLELVDWLDLSLMKPIRPSQL